VLFPIQRGFGVVPFDDIFADFKFANGIISATSLAKNFSAVKQKTAEPVSPTIENN